MIWVAVALILLVPLGILVLIAQDDERLRRARPPMAWLRRLWRGSPQERRHCHRYRASIPLTYRVLPSGTPTAQTTTRDVSFGGVGIVLPEKLALGTPLELILHCEPPIGRVVVQGAIQWVREVPSQPNDPRRLFWAGILIAHTGLASVGQLQKILQQITPDGSRGRA